VAVVLTQVQTKQIRINIHKRNNTKNTVQTIRNTGNTSTHITKTPTGSSCNICVCSSLDATKLFLSKLRRLTLFPIREVAVSYHKSSRVRHIIIAYCRKLDITIVGGCPYDVL
jgi:hypothetical protein